ncbi:MAG TPA: flavodoxin domain-containing protein [Candidatus Limnocylindrales bacterium]|nr:flavodoxin domain-containing protein [Candidatus Limnocylindrales bacterium]
MRVLVAYATRHGATAGIAERIAETLRTRGLDVTLTRAGDVRDANAYDACVIGSAAYMHHWLGDATNLVRRNSRILRERPVWLFSSGPIGSELVDSQGRDVVEASVPEEFGALADDIRPRDRRVFFGAYDPDAPPANVMERLGSVFIRMPAIRAQMPSGDFRDWAAIEAWANGIADALLPAPVATV